MDTWRKELIENLDQYLLDPGARFQFKCLECGKCCKNREDIMLTTRDLYNIAKKLNMTVRDAIVKYCDTYIGHDSRIPIVRLLPRGSERICPLLRNNRCSVHDMKPAVCALFPLGRVMMPLPDNGDADPGAIRTAYILTPISCGSRTRTHTVKSWLERFGIPLEDEFHLLWNETVMFLAEYFCGLEERKTPEPIMDILWNITFGALYAAYDTGVELIPQFRENTEKLRQLLKDLETDTAQLDVLKKLAGGASIGK